MPVSGERLLVSSPSKRQEDTESRKERREEWGQRGHERKRKRDKAPYFIIATIQ